MLDPNDFIYDGEAPEDTQDQQVEPDFEPDMEPDMEPQMDEDETVESPSLMLAESLAHFLGDIVTMYSIVHGYHWNVKGKDFKEFHAFFEDIYNDVYDAEDRIAEYVVTLGYDAPYFPADFAELTCLKGIDRITSGDIMDMVQSILSMNDQMIEETKALFDLATAAKENGIANFIADRQDAHAKWGWQLRATLGLH
jgi:starvation-inducible DNA-binding protein